MPVLLDGFLLILGMALLSYRFIFKLPVISDRVPILATFSWYILAALKNNISIEHSAHHKTNLIALWVTVS
jgi:hypothetical protein